MSTSAPFPNSTPALKLARRVSPAAVDSRPPLENETQRQVAADLAALEVREANLRDYEMRLRAWQTQLDAAAAQPASAGTVAPFLRPPSQTPFSGDAALAAAWEKFHRARALLESEQNLLRDERMALRDAQAELQRREAAIAAREAHLTEREMLLTIAVGTEKEAEEKKSKSMVQRLTQAPWAVFKSDK